MSQVTARSSDAPSPQPLGQPGGSAPANPMEAHAAEAAAFLRALAHDKRLMVLCTLGQGEMSVGALQLALGVSQSVLSQHLAVLRAEGLVSTRRQAQTIFYRIQNPAVLGVIDVLAATFCPPEGA